MKLLLSTLCLSFCLPAVAEVHSSKVLNKIVFGSCHHQDHASPILGEIAKLKPDLFLMIGDNIYGDTYDMAVLKAKYEKLGNKEGFKALRKQTGIIATWDDHDYGLNDGGKGYTKKAESEKVFHDFFQTAETDPRRSRPGLYGAYTFGPVGKRCQVIVLDTRYFRDDIVKSKLSNAEKKEQNIVGWYSARNDKVGSMLGDKQWDWLGKQLTEPADLRIIVSSIQMIADEKRMESWGLLPHERKRFYDLLEKKKANHSVVISGDVHFAELSKVHIGKFPLYDLTSSGLNRPRPNWAAAKNSYRVGEAFAIENAGSIEIDWVKKSLKFGVIDATGVKVMEKEIKLSELEF